MILGDINTKPAIHSDVLIEALETNYYPPEPVTVVPTTEVPLRMLAYWELGIKVVQPVTNIYKLFGIGAVGAERAIGAILCNLHNRGLLHLMNPRGVDGSNNANVTNLRAWRNRIATDKGLMGDVDMFLCDSVSDATNAILFALSIVKIGGSACVRVPNIHTTSLASAVYLFAGYFDTNLHRACTGDLYIIGTNKKKTMRAETMFKLIAGLDNAALYTADYMRGNQFRMAITAMTVTPQIPTIDEWKAKYKFAYANGLC